MRIQFLLDHRDKELLAGSLKGLDRSVDKKVKRSLKTLGRMRWQDALEGNLISRLSKVGQDTVWQIRIGGRPEYRISVMVTNHQGEQSLLVGEITTRESLNGKQKESFVQTALRARDRWIGNNRG